VKNNLPVANLVLDKILINSRQDNNKTNIIIKFRRDQNVWVDSLLITPRVNSDGE